ncbi:MAG: energy-coupling factor transporter ATPase [Clostridia bacterium]|nr:energy-coupling factor transporter ATPase [Clostridia bacterium]
MITLTDVSFSYSEKAVALHNINLTINKGEFLAVLGHNGSGKSTLAKLLNGILVPTSGTVSVLGHDTKDGKNLPFIRQHVGMVFQNPDNQIVATIVEEDVAFGPENLGLSSSEIRQRVDEALKTVGMYAARRHAPHLLSGGQKQRVAIAGVIAMRPDYIVLDEPTAMLDPIGRREVMDTIQRLCREEGITIVLITHFMREAAEADRVLVMEKGAICMEGKPETVLTKRDQMIKVGLDVPQATELLYQLQAGGMQVNKETMEMDACVDAILSQMKGNKE